MCMADVFVVLITDVCTISQTFNARAAIKLGIDPQSVNDNNNNNNNSRFTALCPGLPG